VNGEAHDTSDLDLVVVKDGKIEIGEFIKLKENIKFSNIPILDWNRIPKSFQENIEKKFEVLITEI
jgi:predicted nucleotidyltransferase